MKGYCQVGSHEKESTGIIPGIKDGQEEIKVPGGDIPEDHWLLLGKPLTSESGRITLKEVAVYAV